MLQIARKACQDEGAVLLEVGVRDDLISMRRSPAIDGVKPGGVEQPILAYQFSRNQNMRKAC
jgi:hypothetical protein